MKHKPESPSAIAHSFGYGGPGIVATPKERAAKMSERTTRRLTPEDLAGVGDITPSEHAAIGRIWGENVSVAWADAAWRVVDELRAVEARSKAEAASGPLTFSRVYVLSEWEREGDQWRREWSLYDTAALVFERGDGYGWWARIPVGHKMAQGDAETADAAKAAADEWLASVSDRAKRDAEAGRLRAAIEEAHAALREASPGLGAAQMSARRAIDRARDALEKALRS